MYKLSSVRKFFNNEKNIFLILIFWLIILSFLYSGLSILRHIHFESGAFDLGIYDQALWLYSRFEIPYSTLKERLILGDHLTLTIPLLSPLYYIWDDVKILLIFQSTWLALSSIGIYKIGLFRKLPPITAFTISFAYSIFYGIQFAVFFDFHPVIIAAGLLPWLAYFFETKKRRLFFITLIAVILTQENMGIAVSCLAIIYFFKKKYRSEAILMFILGLVMSLILLKVTGYFSPVGYEYKPVINSFSSLITGFYDHPDKIRVLLYSLSAYMFLPLLSPGSILAALFDLSQYFVSGQVLARMWSPFTHHRIILATILAIGTIDAFVFLARKRINIFYFTIIFLTFTLLQQYIFHYPLNKLSKPIYFQNQEWMNNNSMIIEEVPKNVSIATQQNLAPHLSHRKEIYLLWPKISTENSKCLGQESCWWLDFSGKPIYLIIDTHPGSSLTQLLESRENYLSAVENMEKAGKIRLYKQKSDAKIYKIIY